jgi:hypothetical protein
MLNPPTGSRDSEGDYDREYYILINPRTITGYIVAHLYGVWTQSTCGKLPSPMNIEFRFTQSFAIPAGSHEVCDFMDNDGMSSTDGNRRYAGCISAISRTPQS